MINLQDFVGSGLFKKFEVDNLLFAEFKCPVQEDSNVWWHNIFFAYVLTGEITLKTLQKNYVLTSGDCVFAKKGSIISHHHNVEDLCELLIFVPDDFIKSVIQKHKISFFSSPNEKKSDTIIPLIKDEVLGIYFHSLLTYFSEPEPPPEPLLKLKFEELILNIVSGNKQTLLECYLHEICKSSKPSIKEIMELNFTSKLSLDEFARLCVRSLSAFKQDFKNIYHTTPGKWLQQKRLEYSRYLIETTTYSIDEICDLSGFENCSHFTRVFKNKYGLPPGKFNIRQKTIRKTINDFIV